MRHLARTYLGLSLPLVVGTVLLSCTDAGLKLNIKEDIQYVDNKLGVTGQFCTGPSDEITFPVKLLIVADQSASLQCTDAGNNRLEALNKMGSELNHMPNVEFGVVGFASWSKVTEFTSNWSDAAESLDLAGGPATDYQGALSTVLRMLEMDMINAGPAVRARTKYVVVFMSDGIPEPRCKHGCDDGDELPDSLYGVCNTDKNIPDSVYVDMEGLCPDYNQPEQIVQKIQDIISLKEFYGVGALTLNTVLLFADAAEVEEVCPGVEQFGYVREEAMPLLQAMADEGNGTFRDVHISTDLDFLTFNYDSLEAPYVLSEFFAINTSIIPSEKGLLVDSDHDGIDDATEFKLSLNRQNPDSDGDFFSDFFELKFLSRGFDPTDGTVPAIGCDKKQDRDGDGLRECEELFLGTDPLLPDTDGDRLTDGIEFRFGLNPLEVDVYDDPDFDGLPSGVEVRAGTNPLVFDENKVVKDRVLYSVVGGEPNEDSIKCYDFSAQGLSLNVPLPSVDGTTIKGLNRIEFYAQEEPLQMAGSRGRIWKACVEARYLGDTFKDPPSGRIEDLTPEYFVEIQDFDPDKHCMQLGASDAGVTGP